MFFHLLFYLRSLQAQFDSLLIRPSLFNDLIWVKIFTGQVDTPSTFHNKWFFVAIYFISFIEFKILEFRDLTLLFLVECKFWSRKVPQDAVLILISICDDLGAHKGIRKRTKSRLSSYLREKQRKRAGKIFNT